MTVTVDVVSPPCATEPEVYHDEQLHAPPSRADLSSADWERLNVKRAAAHRQCAGCPMMVDCLYRAVVEVDVSGFVACTTEDDRAEIRRQLGIEIQQSSTTPYGTARVGSGPVSHDAVMAARQAYPKDTCHQLAERLDCSTSTVKRHLRRAREQKLVQGAAVTAAVRAPSVDAVLDCFDQLESSRVA
ncbi:WhiB family transcriptional regulator [Aeromicrobium endophyticum]|uniref:Transcription factor WhiB n=1 Tax=Aeromicrobium endophyticum TaxID=2292704 RepID=A0A371PAN7_9ACTN|nr:WhiB family transcriptional regulator [Aeromicrobium endophyticum]REK73024.1 transcription factor WhiB [Aeromicrobium endophyticum]